MKHRRPTLPEYVMSIHRLFCATTGLIIVLLFSIRQPVHAQTASISGEALDGLKFRSIGPAVTGGRIHDVEALPADPSTIFVATASGGIWKSTNKGTTWASVFDDKPVSTFGDLAIAPSNPFVVWAGTGEQQNRQSTSWGNGIYRSVNGGATWDHKGLEETRHIGRVRVHPANPDVVYVAALGNLWKASEDRGVFRTKDGGDSWEKILYVDEHTGAVDLVMSPANPDILYAATYQRRRRTWGFNGGGPGSGIYMTMDGGETWRELTRGLPEGDKGRIGLGISRTNPRVLYATVEHTEESGVYRTADGGASWEKVNSLNPRPMYYSHIYVDPTDEKRVYVLATEFYMSEEGGKLFRRMPTRPTYDVGVHSDHHAMWIDPGDPEHFYLAGDAGLNETWDRGQTYGRLNNLSIGQFYAIGVDMSVPYRVYGGMQDNHSWVGPSATRSWSGILNDDWRQVGFGDGMYHQPDPNNEFVYSNAQNGNITRLHADTGDLLDIRPYPPAGEKPYRFDWVNPVVISGHDAGTVYVGGNRLFISRDRGVSWTRTADLTRQAERDSLFLMGVQGKDIRISKNDGTSGYGEITTISESPLNRFILWVGTDDGNVQVTLDGGRHWGEVSQAIPDLPGGSYVSRVVASKRSVRAAYATFDAHRDGDPAPYAYRTNDFGASWEKITDGLPGDGSVNVLVEHPDNPDLLFLGTEHALFVSTTAGEDWTRFRSNLPTTLYDDLVIHPRDNDLVVGTHGRGIWILDDLAPLAEWTGNTAAAPLHLFGIRDATIFQYWKDTSYRGQAAFAGTNPDFGAYVTYHLDSPVDSVVVKVTNEAGDTVRELAGPGSDGTIHRVVWDLRHEPPPYRETSRSRPGLVLSETILPVLPRPTSPVGPFVSPGLYSVTVQAAGLTASDQFRVLGDPKLAISEGDWKERETFLVGVLFMQREVWDRAERASAARSSLVAYRDSLRALDPMPEELLDRSEARADSAAARSGRIGRLRSRISSLAGALNGRGVRQGSLFPPTETHRDLKKLLTDRLAATAEELRELDAWAEDVRLRQR